MTDKFLGDLASFKFGSTVYQCLQNYGWNGSVDEAVAKCSGASGAVTHRAASGTQDTFTFDTLVDAGDVTTLNALKRGVTGAFEFHPEGDAATNIEFVATNAVITSSNLAGSVGAFGVLSITIGIDGALTIQAASA